MREELDRKVMAALSGGHLAVDFASGAVPALLPFLVLEFDSSYTATAALMLAVLVSSSVVQPLFGLWSDRRGAMWLLPGGVAVAGVGTGLAAAAPSYALVLLLVFIAGIGIAAITRRARSSPRTPAAGSARAGCLLQHRRQHRVRARSDRRHAARDLAGARGRADRDAAVLVVAVILFRVLPALRRVAPSIRRAGRATATTTSGRCRCSPS